MFELMYPPEPALVYPRPSYRGTQIALTGEMLPLVDVHGIVTGRACRSWCHGPERPLHPVVHLNLLSRSGEIYLQKRSETKDLLPGYWDTAVGGHVTYGEQLEEALMREAGEELGLFDFNPLYLKTYVWESKSERELVNVFAAVGHFRPEPDRDEVSEGRFWSFDEVDKTLGLHVLTPNFEHEYSQIRPILQALL